MTAERKGDCVVLRISITNAETLRLLFAHVKGHCSRSRMSDIIDMSNALRGIGVTLQPEYVPASGVVTFHEELHLVADDGT